MANNAGAKKAIRKMLALPATDPNNWYRRALIHTIDCPHGNWWFYVWHRGYVGYFEQTIRTHGPDAVGFYLSGQLLTED